MTSIPFAGGTAVRSRLRACAAPLALFALVLPEAALRAQAPVEGYAASMLSLPTNSSHGVPMAGGVVYFDGFGLAFDAGTGGPPTILLSTGPVFPSFVLALDAQTVLFGESSQGDIWLVPLAGPPPAAPLARIPLNYDATRLDAGAVVVSAKPGGFATPDCDLVELDLQTGATATIGVVPGASGPVLAPPRVGGLLYATGTLLFPAPGGTADILHWPAATLAAARTGGAPLGTGNATVLFAGLDAVGSMALDGDGDLLFTDWFLDRLGEVDDLFGPRPVAKTVTDYSQSTLSATHVQFVAPAAASGAEFEPFQDAGGGSLHVTESDYLSVHQLTAIEARRAALTAPTASIPPGPFAVTLTDGPAHGTAFVVVSLLAPAPFETRVSVPGFEQSLGWNPASTAPLLSEWLPLDAAGQGVLQSVNPGLNMLGLSLQAAFADQPVEVLGSTAAISIALQ